MFSRVVLSLLFFGPTAILLAQTASPSFELSRDTTLSNTSESSNSAIVTGDFNNDGKLDLIVGGGATPLALTLRLGNGDGTFQAPVAIGTADNAYIADMAVADVNNDGNMDLIVSTEGSGGQGGGFQVFLGKGNGTFQAPLAYTTPYPAMSVAVRDFNGDGYADIAVGTSYGSIYLYNNVSGKSFTLAKTLTPGNSSSSIKVRAGQFDGNGINDLAATVGAALYVLWNDGKENFTADDLPGADNPYISDMNVGALNMNGRDDILVSYQCNINYQTDTQCGGIQVFYGQGNQQMLEKTVVTQANILTTGKGAGIDSPVALWAVDVNGDGIGDIVAEPYPAGLGNIDDAPGGLYVWLGNPDGTFSQTPINYLPTTHGNGALVPGDFNRDGMMDFAQTLPFDEQTEIFINGGKHATCSAYTISPTVTVCQPVNNTYLPSPVTVQASLYDTSKTTAIQEYVDGALDYNEDVTSFSKAFTLAAGPHLLVTKGWDTTGIDFDSDRTITAYLGTPGAACPVAAEGSAAICLPAGATSEPSVQILANGWTANVPTAAELYIDGDLVVDDKACNSTGGDCDGGTSYVDTTQSLAPGSHDLVFKLWDDEGNVYTAQKTVTVE